MLFFFNFFAIFGKFIPYKIKGNNFIENQVKFFFDGKEFSID